jgi:hypothetical protein
VNIPGGCAIGIETLAPLGEWRGRAALVDQLEAFPNSKVWSIYLRRPLLRLPPGDVRRLERWLAPLVGMLDDNIKGYLDRAGPDAAR